MKKRYYLKSLLICFILILIGCSSDNDAPDNDTSDNDTPEPNNTTNLQNGLVGKFDLNGNGNDTSVNQNNGNIIGSVISTKNRKGNNNSAMLFNELNGYIDVGNVNELKLTSNISISVWVKSNGNLKGWETIVNKWKTTGGSSGIGYYLGLNPNGLSLRWNISSHIIEMSSAFPINEWVHIVVTFNNQKLRLYLNSILINETTTNGIIYDNNNPFRIGQQSDINIGDEGFNGAIDDVFIYNRVLNSSEIIELFNS